MRQIPEIAKKFIAEHEGVRLASYLDGAQVWTVGYGHTGPEVHAGLVITTAEAAGFLYQDLDVAGRRLERVVSAAVIEELTEHQYSALVSFVFNVGADPDWTIWKRLNARHFDQVPTQLQRFVNAGGKKIQGLVNRRAAEVVLWSTHEPGSTPEVLPSSLTRMEETPPTPIDPIPATKSLTVGGAAAAVVLQAPAVAKTVIDGLTPWSVSPWAVHLIQVVGILAVVATALVLLAIVLKKQEAHR